MARTVVSGLGAPRPLSLEVRVVVIGLKILSILFALFTVVGWWRAASFLAQLGVGPGGPLAGLAAGIAASMFLYGFAVLVQSLAALAGGDV
jgi:hypothetical protein